MDCVVQWATILSPIIAVVIAILASKSSKKDTDKKLAALEESTHKQIAALDKSTKEQVESIKSLAKLQLDTSIQQVNIELEKNLILAKQALEEVQVIQEINKSPFSHVSDYRDKEIRKFQEEKPQRDLQRYSEYIQMLEEIKKGLEKYKDKLK